MSEIIPVTRDIRKYLEDGNEVVANISNYDEALKYYTSVALVNGKSLIWVYQSLVLSGYGKYVDINSDMYQVSLMAYLDVLKIMSGSKKKRISFFEKYCILDGTIYEDMFKIEQLGKVRSLR